VQSGNYQVKDSSIELPRLFLVSGPVGPTPLMLMNEHLSLDLCSI